MDKFVIQGNYRLRGAVDISGSKNAALPILAATLLTSEPCIIENVPNLKDIRSMARLLKGLGSDVQFTGTTIKIASNRDIGTEAPYKIVKEIRASFCVLGPILARKKQAKVSFPGGCVIGVRPVDLHLKGMSLLGADIKIEGGYVVANAKNLKGARIYLAGAYGSSVLATANVLMAATYAKGTTLLENVATEPEVVDLANFLIKMGAKIKGAGSPVIEVTGVKNLRGVRYRIIPDRIEAGTYAIAGAMIGDGIEVKNCINEHMGAVINFLKEVNVPLQVKKDSLWIGRPKKMKSVNITTFPYPGFPTDLQAQAMALLSITPGISVICEKVFPNRFTHIAELNRMGADIKIEGQSAIVQGVKGLSGAPLTVSDLRAGAALVLAGLVAKGRTDVLRVYHLDRGYEHMETKISGLGGCINREKE
jgi:UDP-N-acetylglucosamine 1-carboxyvinyltransferase